MAGAAQNALAEIAANLRPGNWTKTKTSEEDVRTFNVWYKSYGRWTNICMHGINIDDMQKWDLVVATGVPDLHNVIKETDIIMIS